MTLSRYKGGEYRRMLARREGIALTPQGEPLFARDRDRWLELGKLTPPLTETEQAIEDGLDEHYRRLDEVDRKKP